MQDHRYKQAVALLAEVMRDVHTADLGGKHSDVVTTMSLPLYLNRVMSDQLVNDVAQAMKLQPAHYTL